MQRLKNVHSDVQLISNFTWMNLPILDKYQIFSRSLQLSENMRSLALLFFSLCHSLRKCMKKDGRVSQVTVIQPFILAVMMMKRQNGCRKSWVNVQLLYKMNLGVQIIPVVIRALTALVLNLCRHQNYC